MNWDNRKKNSSKENKKNVTYGNQQKDFYAYDNNQNRINSYNNNKFN